MATRLEHDLLGDKEVPADAYYGVQTARGLENFDISGVQLRLALPVEEDAAIAQRLNANEAVQPDAHQLGAWCLDPERGLSFVSFIPSAVYMPDLLRALVYHAAGRNEWARALLFPQ